MKGKELNRAKKAASRYFKKEADQGHFESMKKYANMLYEGDGIEKNKKEASRYYKLASNNNE